MHDVDLGRDVGERDGPVDCTVAAAGDDDALAGEPAAVLHGVEQAAPLEGPEAGTYLRGEAQLVDGTAVIDLPEYFALVTAEEGLTVQLTSIGGWAPLYVVEVSTETLIVGCDDAPDAAFYYQVNGVRLGYEDFEVIRDKGAEAAGAYGAPDASSAEETPSTYPSGPEEEK